MTLSFLNYAASCHPNNNINNNNKNTNNNNNKNNNNNDKYNNNNMIMNMNMNNKNMNNMNNNNNYMNDDDSCVPCVACNFLFPDFPTGNVRLRIWLTRRLPLFYRKCLIYAANSRNVGMPVTCGLVENCLPACMLYAIWLGKNRITTILLLGKQSLSRGAMSFFRWMRWQIRW